MDSNHWQLRPELETILQCLSLNGYSVSSLIDDVYARRTLNSEDESTKMLREGMERDAADICARLLCRITSGPETVLRFGKVQFKIHRHVVPIDILPDDTLLDIFYLCLHDPTGLAGSNWHTLVHVCQRWRRIVFASPRRLDLYLHFSSRTPPVRTNLPFWPANLPLTVDYSLPCGYHYPAEEDSINALLVHPSRLHRIKFHAPYDLVETVAITMQQSFPMLTHLDFGWTYEWPSSFPVIPLGFLGESTGLLQHLRLSYISFPQLPKFLLSTPSRNLITLKLNEIVVPPNGYMSPKAMVKSLSVLTRLTTFSLSYNTHQISQSGSGHLGSRSGAVPLKRAVLPSLTDLHFKGCSKYSEDFLARIDTPLIANVIMEYEYYDLEVPQLSRFIERSENLKPYQFTRADVTLFLKGTYFKLDRPQGKCSLSLILGQEHSSMPVMAMTGLLGHLAAMFPNVDDLFAHGDHVTRSGIHTDIEWRPFFTLFPAVETLRLSGRVAPHIASVLTADEGIFADLLPALQSIRFIKGKDDNNEDLWNKVVESIDQFLSLRQRSGRSVTLVNSGDERVEAAQMRLKNP